MDPAHPGQVFALTDTSTLVFFVVTQSKGECQVVAQIPLDGEAHIDRISMVGALLVARSATEGSLYIYKTDPSD